MRKYIILLLTIVLNIFVKAQETTKKSPFILGEVHVIESTILSENRVLNIYLPVGYNNKTKDKYPVIYLLDGAKDEDFIHTVGLVQYNTFSWVNRMPESIVVGIANIDRKRDFTFPTTIKKDKKRFSTSGQSKAFTDFIEKELKPYIEQTFKTSGQNTLIGQSLGGLLATEILVKQPQMFNNYIIISPSLWWDNRSLLRQIPTVSSKGNEDIKVYIGVGKEGHSTKGVLMEDDAKVLYQTLKPLGYKNTIYDYLSKENHATVGHQSLINAFIWLYQ